MNASAASTQVWAALVLGTVGTRGTSKTSFPPHSNNRTTSVASEGYLQKNLITALNQLHNEVMRLEKVYIPVATEVVLLTKLGGNEVGITHNS
jgi:hypothetical protein